MIPYPHCHAALASSEHGLVLALFLAGLAGSLTHCAGMCGPFVLAQITGFEAPAGKSASWLRRLLLPYHLGRATTYILLGVMASLLTVSVLQVPALNIITHLLLVLAGILFIASAFSGFLPQFSFGLCGAPSWLMTRIAPLLPSHSQWSGYILGVLLGFLPCGLVYAALLAVAASASPLMAAAGMAAFALGTAPALITIGLGGHALLPRKQAWAKGLSAALMAFNGITLFILAGKGLV